MYEPAGENMPLPLDGIRVIDLTQVMAGPFCTMLLGDLGADIIKIEPPGTGDLSRSMGGARLRLRGTDHAPFLALNRNKRSVVLDLKNASDHAALRALARTADVFVESFRPDVMPRLGLDYDTLARAHPGLIYLSISGFGASGPWADRPGFDLIAQGMAGVMSVTGEAGGDPVKCGVPISDLAAGLYGALGIEAALLARARTGRGQRVETSLFEAALSLSVWEATEYFATGQAPQPCGSAHRLNAPYQALRTADGHVNIAALTVQQWQRLCATLGLAELERDERFATNAQRMAHLPALVTVLERALAGATTERWTEQLLQAGVPAGPILDYAQVFSHAHTQARHMVEVVEHPNEGSIRTIGFPLKLSDTPARVRKPPPLLGQHTAEILETIRPEDHFVNAPGGAVHFEVKNSIAWLTFDRASARNAMTWSMYEQLDALLARLEAERTIKAAVLRGGHGTFVSGTDIAQFSRFQSGADGLDYERRLEEVVARLERIRLPTLAAVEGFATGAGLILAAACDLRICTPDAQFGMPIARTVGNCLSMANCARLIDAFGAARAKAMIFTAELMHAEAARACGFVTAIVAPDQLDAELTRLCQRLIGNAPITLTVTKEAVRRIGQSQLPADDDLIARAYGSRDFKEGVEAFLAKRAPRWQGL
jgi:crotonobetainyl-CoA:carnitine CoA-transferase CaiB-like acyl-CoA transferase/enoyl-CoA hydratase/carnithine racemase